ncbi:Endo-beta-N-acetylglucosaminidase [Streptococcus oralis]|uniref:Endo-beta-N-acetylglucosaminidase n=1 Tax=Streptococcus oralis TaxID=1303 RepID=A0A139P5E6_STROR|nr:Endo-beta-N-acetylglucosaminidase [Streptococcus oralis]
MISTATLLAFSCSVVHADSARQSKIKELDSQRSELAKKNGVTGYLADGRWYSLVEAENNVDSLKQQVEVLKVPYSEKNTIKVSSEYAKALKDNFNLKKSEGERERAEEILKSESAKLVLQKNNFVTAASDEIEVYDVDKLPKEVVIELNYFALDMINQVRRQMGTPELTLAQSSIDFASKLSVKVKEANRGVWDWHYVKGINEVAREYGLPTSSKEDEEKEYGYQYYENSAGSFSVSKQSTKAELKRAIYDAILRFLYDGDEFLHANSISGLNWGEPSKAEYFGFSMNLLKDGTEMSFITVSDDQLSKSTKKNFSTKTPANTTESNRKSILGKKEKELESEKGKLEKLQLSYKEYEKISKEIDKLNEEEEKEKERIRKEEQNKKNSATTKPSQSTQKQDKPKTNASSSKQGSSTVSKNGWLKENGSWYFYNAGKRLTNTWQGSYYLKSDGRMAESEWIYDNSYKAWYYLKSNGIYVRDSWQGSYYLKSNGKMADKEWVYDNYYQSWFYLKEGGAYVNHQWLKIDGVWYYFKSGGYMVSNAWQGSYYLKSSGAMAVNEWIYDSYWGGWYYLKSDGSYARNEIVQGKYRVDYSGKWI